MYGLGVCQLQRYVTLYILEDAVMLQSNTRFSTSCSSWNKRKYENLNVSTIDDKIVSYIYDIV